MMMLIDLFLDEMKVGLKWVKGISYIVLSSVFVSPLKPPKYLKNKPEISLVTT